MEKVSFKFDNPTQTSRNVTLHICKEFFAEHDIAVTSAEAVPGTSTVDFNFDIALPAGSYAFIFEDDEKLQIGTASNHLPGFERKLDGCYLDFFHPVCEFFPPLQPYQPGNVVNDNGRSVDGAPSLWMADGSYGTLTLAWDEPVELSEIDITFDTNLDRINIDQIAPECVKAFVLKLDGREVFRKEDNSQRFVRCVLPEKITASKATLEITATNGDKFARVVAVRCF